MEGVVDTGVVSKLQSSLERVEKELLEAKERKASLERECVIYQTQLDVSDTTRSYQYMYMYINACEIDCGPHLGPLILWGVWYTSA